MNGLPAGAAKGLLPFPTDPISAGVQFVGEFFKSIFGLGDWNPKRTQEEINARAAFCSNPATWNPQVCGPDVWHATKCADGTIAPMGGSCSCPLSAVIFPSPAPSSGGCSRMQALKDNWFVFAGAGLLLIVLNR